MAAAVGVGVVLTGGTAPAGEYDVAVFGVQPEGAGVPTTLTDGRLPEPGENGTAAIDQELADEGVAIGDSISVGTPSAEAVEVVRDYC